MASPSRSAELHTGGSDCAALVGRIAAGDAPAFAAFYDTTCGLVYGLLLRILGNSAAAEQVLLDVYREVWERADTCDGGEKPLAWVVTLAHARAVDRLRGDGDGRPTRATPEAAGHLPTTRPKTDELPSGLQPSAQSALAVLPPRQQQIIELAYFSGLRRDEIAARLGLSLQAVQAELRTGMMRLRDALESSQLNPA